MSLRALVVTSMAVVGAWLALRFGTRASVVVLDVGIAVVASFGAVWLVRALRGKRRPLGRMRARPIGEVLASIDGRLRQLRSRIATVASYLRELEGVAGRTRAELAQEPRASVRETLEENLSTYEALAADQRRWHAALVALHGVLDEQRAVLARRLEAAELTRKVVSSPGATEPDVGEFARALAELDAEMEGLVESQRALADQAQAAAEVEELVARWRGAE